MLCASLNSSEHPQLAVINNPVNGFNRIVYDDHSQLAVNLKSSTWIYSNGAAWKNASRNSPQHPGEIIAPADGLLLPGCGTGGLCQSVYKGRFFTDKKTTSCTVVV
jgi:hypothetical protein